MWLRASVAALACSSALADDFFESFDDARTPCITVDTKGGFSLAADGGRFEAAKDEGVGNGTADGGLTFDVAGDFAASVHVDRDALGRFGTIGLLVLFDDGHFINIYFRGMEEISAVNSINGRDGYFSENARAAVFRLRRVGTTIHYEYDEGNGFVSLGADTVPGATRLGRAHLFLSNYLNETVAYSGSFDDWSVSADAFGGATCFCPADMNGDGTLNLVDFLVYQTAYGNENSAADFAPPFGVLNLFDFLQFQTEFGSGCGG